MRKFLFLFLFSLSSAFSSEIYFCKNELEVMPVQAGGRVKPLGVHAAETLKFITGKAKTDEFSSTTLFCLKTLEAFGFSAPKIELKVEHPEVVKLLPNNPYELQSDNSELQNTLRSQYQAQKENNGYKKELAKVLERLDQYDAMIRGFSWTVPVLIEGKVEWKPFIEFLTPEQFSKPDSVTSEGIFELLMDRKADYDHISDDYLLEHTYFKFNPFLYAIFLVIAALSFLYLLKNKIIGLVFIGLSMAVQISGMVMRILISGRAPVTNMYETVMFSGIGCMVLAIIIYIYRKDLKFLYAGLGYNLLTLLMMKFANNMLTPSISPLVPVLRDNFWLSTHVTTIILSYAALALSWLLSNITLIQMALGKITKENIAYNAGLIYSAIKFGVILLATGIILGGVWADYSWGRFWGWDPKETWSLIVLLIYMAILHGRMTNWIRPHRFIPLTALAFLSVMMAWFGVNYILAVGLHSYGFSEGGAIFLGTFFIIQIVLVFLTGAKFKMISVMLLLISCAHKKTDFGVSDGPILDLARSSYLKGCTDSKTITGYEGKLFDRCLQMAKVHENEIKDMIKE